MPLNCGIVGLPNVGKSTIFQALTSAPAEVAAYPFCTIDPNVGVVEVPDERLYRVASYFPADRITPATVEFVDIAGLVKGASRGEGLGNQFLARIRETGLICHVVRCFEDEDVAHVSGTVDPVSDIETVNIELALADVQTVERRLAKTEKSRRSADKETARRASEAEPVLERLAAWLSEGRPARTAGLAPEEERLVADLHLITMKKQLYVCNVDESRIPGDDPLVRAVRNTVERENRERAAGSGSTDGSGSPADDAVGSRAGVQTGLVVLCGKLEAEIAALTEPEERELFLREAGLAESGRDRLIREAYALLGLRTFFTVGPKEIRAWTFRDGTPAREAAGIVHSDFEHGFVRAETYHCEDLFACGSEQKVREAGRLRLEGKDYRVRDGDVLFFKYNL